MDARQHVTTDDKQTTGEALIDDTAVDLGTNSQSSQCWKKVMIVTMMLSLCL